MKSSRLIGLSLTLLMLLLVLSAGFAFLFQGRQTLSKQNEELETSLNQVEQELGVTYNSLEESIQAVETVQATNLLLEEDLVESQQEVDQLMENVAILELENGVVAQEISDYLGNPPSIEILTPDLNESYPLDEPLDYSFVVADGVGVTAVIVSIDGELVEDYSLPGPPIAHIEGVWTPDTVGSVILGIQASNERTSILMTRTLTVTIPQAPFDPLVVPPNFSIRQEIETAVSQVRGLQSANIENIDLVEVNNNTSAPASISNIDDSDTLNLFSLAFDLDPEIFFNGAPISIRYDPIGQQLLTEGPALGEPELDAPAYTIALLNLLYDQNFRLPNRSTINQDAWLAYYGFTLGDTASVIANISDSGLLANDSIDQPEQNVEPSLYNRLQLHGENFVGRLLAEDGYTAVDAVWSQLPSSTEQLIHPEKYFEQEEPIEVEIELDSDDLFSEWSVVEENSFGEAMLQLYLANQLNGTQIDTATSGWGGDKFILFENQTNEDQFLLILKIIWDSIEDSNEFAAIYPTYPTRLFTAAGELQSGGECWQGDDVICLYQISQETLIIRAPDLETAVAVSEELRN